MNRRTKRRLQRNVKMIAVCGAMAYLATGVTRIVVESQRPDTLATLSAQMLDETAEVLLQKDEKDVAKPAENEYLSIVMPMDFEADELYLLAKIAMAEAEGEDTEGKALVVRVVLNRVWSGKFPGTIEEVIMEQHRGVHQFSVTQDGGRWWKTEPDIDCYKAVEMVMEGWDKSQGAMYFESKSNSTWHQDNLEFLFKHGNHYFYKDMEE